MLAVHATYLLSEEGRKASLLVGGDGRALQQLTVHVPAARLHLVHVDADGVARLKLRPRYELGADHRVTRIDVSPTYDAPPDIEELFRLAAGNHQLERAYEVQRRAARVTRQESEQQRRAEAAREFLSDPTRRAADHPAPSMTRCYLDTPQGRILFDARTDESPARDVPAEAHRRFRADLRNRKERNRQERAEQLAVHEQKKRAVGEWISHHGTPDQCARVAAGLLSLDEAIEAMTDQVFAPLSAHHRYVRDGAKRLEAAVRRRAGLENVRVDPREVRVVSRDAPHATAAQWAALQHVREAIPNATATLREHRVIWDRDRRADYAVIVIGLLVTQRVGLLTLRREYVISADGDSEATQPQET